ncbi:MAG: DUF4140 domain-containing protein [Candidatus Omnitrophica bacterium]|nr:DUF4140 domain-containing protein [Candidatus Omnitrophota bacterium]
MVWFFLFITYASASEIEVESKINQVTVYSDSALVTRIANLKLNPRVYKVIFPNLIPEVDENSLRVSKEGEAEVKLFGAQLKKEFLEEISSERIKQLKDQIQRLEDEIKQLQNFKEILLEEKNFLDSIRLFSKEQIPKRFSYKDAYPERFR